MFLTKKYSELERLQIYGPLRAALGRNFIGPENVSMALGVTYTSSQLDELAQRARMISTEEIGKLERGEFMLVAGPPLKTSLSKIQTAKPDYFELGCRTFKAEMNFGWIAIQKEEAAVDSIGKTWQEQTEGLIDGDMIPTTTEVVWCWIAHMFCNKIFPNRVIGIRTDSIDYMGHPYVVDPGDSRRISIQRRSKHLKDEKIGLAKAKKF